MKDVIVYGCGSLGRVLEQIIFDINQHSQKYNLIGFVDDDPQKHGLIVSEYPVLGGIQKAQNHRDASIVIGFSMPTQRHQAFKTLTANGLTDFETLIHPEAWISRRVQIGVGSIIYPGVHVDIDVIIGRHCIFNKLCTIGHDSIFEDFVTAAPGVNFGGNIHIGKGCEFGINSSTIQGIEVGEWTVIGAGAVVTKNIPARCTAVGMPAKPIKTI